MVMHKGFTLIELLVVVLIIGILAAIALPQYQKAVERSRVSVYLPLMDTIANAKELYYLEHGVYPSQTVALNMDIQMPSTCTPRSNGPGKITNDWACEGGFLFDMNGAGGVRLMYCPGEDANGNKYNIRQNTCNSKKKYEIWRWQKHAPVEYSQGDEWHCYTLQTDLGRKICPSLNMPWYDE
ncbi:MAG: prepilin-type N-terminal cleavage/methylation domain-containing protein [Elusimicrobiaceae bacterium]|nr:prepilin-type N-terminal cleavage/methylation domain-containing protein [Elusimicrobiaceae bacterium]